MPDGALVYAVGDIHGRSDLLRSLIGKITRDSKARLQQGQRPIVIFLGDYVDRGPDSRGVIELLLHDLPSAWMCRFLKGNHEDALLSFLRDPKFGDVWRDYGGLQTLASYGVAPARTGGEIDWPVTAQAFDAVFPQEHAAFLSRLTLYETVGDYVFVHAGVRPRIPLEYQSEQDLLWIREEFTAAGRVLPQTVVYGHTPSEAIVVGDGRIGLDTGAYVTGKLTAAGFQGANVWYLST
ncbi:MAG: metallophosphoesterase family protein [Rhizomicrobium sp.]|jgi:serine/threonine protein phosphatase 1